MCATQASPGKSPMVSARFSRVKLDLISPITTALPVRTMQIRTPIWRRINNSGNSSITPRAAIIWNHYANRHGASETMCKASCLYVRRRNMHWSVCRRGYRPDLGQSHYFCRVCNLHSSVAATPFAMQHTLPHGIMWRHTLSSMMCKLQVVLVFCCEWAVL